MTPEDICKKLVALKHQLDEEAKKLESFCKAQNDDDQQAETICFSVEAAMRFALLAEEAEHVPNPRKLGDQVDPFDMPEAPHV